MIKKLAFTAVVATFGIAVMVPANAATHKMSHKMVSHKMSHKIVHNKMMHEALK